MRTLGGLDRLFDVRDSADKMEYAVGEVGTLEEAQPSHILGDTLFPHRLHAARQ